jgi:uncharacterized RDD family membrane protein YckC
LPAEQFEPFDPQSNEAAAPQWKQEVNQRLAAHRSRRGGTQDGAASRAAESPRTGSARAAEAAARVAARYAKAPSYSELLAGEARAVVRAAGAAAEAARNAQAAAEAVLAGLESGPVASGSWEPAQQEPEVALHAYMPAAAAASRWKDEPPATDNHSPEGAMRQASYAGAQPRWEEALPVTSPAPQAGRDVWSEMRVHPSPEPDKDGRGAWHGHSSRAHEHYADEGELFPEADFDSYDPMGSATVEPVQHLPANLIEFPRELVATRKARPRLAEGPFYDASHHNSQLSIFEVDPDSLTAPVRLHGAEETEVAPPEWASIELDHLHQADELAHSEPAQSLRAYTPQSYVSGAEFPPAYADEAAMEASAVEELPAELGHQEAGHPGEPAIRYRNPLPGAAVDAESAPEPELLVAPISDRVLAAVVDGALVTLAFLAAAVVVIASTVHPPAGRLALVACGCGWLLFGLLYQFLFLSFAEEGTPGMRYARIALCTFDDDNPTVEQMRQRIPALVLSALPACLGLGWAIFDKDHLGWHDRMTKTYQRKY